VRLFNQLIESCDYIPIEFRYHYFEAADYALPNMSDPRQEQRIKLIRAAYDLVAEVGVSGLRTREIARRAGVNIATLHYCFDGKDALLQALYNYIRDQFYAEAVERIDQARTARAKIVAHGELRKHLLREEPTSVRVWRAFIGEAWVNPFIREIVRRHLAEQRERMAAIIAQGRSEGAFPNLPKGDNRVGASILMALFEGLMVQHAMDPEAFEMEEYTSAVLGWLGLGAEVDTGQAAIA